MEEDKSTEIKTIDVFVVAGEDSGDMHGANLVRALKAQKPDIQVRGFGGPRLRDAGCELALDLTQFAVMGLLKVLPLVGRFMDVINQFHNELVTARPKVVVLIDYPGLNFILARVARRLGIPVVYYCCPQLWAWAPWRARKIKKLAQKLLVIFPFEKAFFSGGRAEVTHVGHPLCDELSAMDAAETRRSVRSRFDIPDDALLVGLFPGSRRQEVAGLGAIMRDVAARLTEKHPRARFVFSCLKEKYASLIAGKNGWPVLHGPGEPLMAACDVALVASGTASLALAFFRKPMVVVYPLARWKRRLFRFLSTTPFICSTNLLAGRRLINEYFVLPGGENVDHVTQGLSDFLAQEKARSTCRQALAAIGDACLQSGASQRAAQEVLAVCGFNPV